MFGVRKRGTSCGVARGARGPSPRARSRWASGARGAAHHL